MAFFTGKGRVALSALMCLSAMAAIAQQKRYPLSALAQAAEKHLPVLLQKQALINGARASFTEVKHSFLPQIRASDQVNLGTDNSLAGSYLPIGITPSSSAGVRNANDLQAVTGNIGTLYGEYNLVTFGLNKALLSNANAYVNLQQADLEQQQYEVDRSVAISFFTLLKTQYRLGADKQNTNRYDSIFRVIKALAASGIKPGADSSLAKAELSKARIIYNQTLGTLRQQKEQLAYLTGVPVNELYVDTLAIDLNTAMPVINIPADTIHHPLLAYYIQQNNVLSTEQAVIRKSYSPKVVLAAATWARGSGIQYNDNYKSLSTGLGYQRFNYMAGLAVTYNLFSGLYKRDRLAVNRFQQQAGGYDLEQQKLQLGLAASQAEQAIQTTEANLQEMPVQLKAAEDTYRQKLAQYKAGIISLIDLTNASFVLYRSQTDYIETRNDWYLAQLDKAVANGTLTTFIQAIK